MLHLLVQLHLLVRRRHIAMEKMDSHEHHLQVLQVALIPLQLFHHQSARQAQLHNHLHIHVRIMVVLRRRVRVEAVVVAFSSMRHAISQPHPHDVVLHIGSDAAAAVITVVVHPLALVAQ